MPGSIVYTADKLIDSIKNIDSNKEKFEEKYDAFYKKYCYMEDGHASERIVDIMLNGGK